MRNYTVKETKELTKIICNRCRKEIPVSNGIPAEDVLSVEKRWNYFSNKDNEEHAFDLCEKCYDELVSGFQIPIEIIAVFIRVSQSKPFDCLIVKFTPFQVI